MGNCKCLSSPDEDSSESYVHSMHSQNISEHSRLNKSSSVNKNDSINDSTNDKNEYKHNALSTSITLESSLNEFTINKIQDFDLSILNNSTNIHMIFHDVSLQVISQIMDTMYKNTHIIKQIRKITCFDIKYEKQHLSDLSKTLYNVGDKTPKELCLENLCFTYFHNDAQYANITCFAMLCLFRFHDHITAITIKDRDLSELLHNTMKTVLFLGEAFNGLRLLNGVDIQAYHNKAYHDNNSLLIAGMLETFSDVPDDITNDLLPITIQCIYDNQDKEIIFKKIQNMYQELSENPFMFIDTTNSDSNIITSSSFKFLLKYYAKYCLHPNNVMMATILNAQHSTTSEFHLDDFKCNTEDILMAIHHILFIGAEHKLRVQITNRLSAVLAIEPQIYFDALYERLSYRFTLLIPHKTWAVIKRIGSTLSDWNRFQLFRLSNILRHEICGHTKLRYCEELPISSIELCGQEVGHLSDDLTTGGYIVKSDDEYDRDHFFLLRNCKCRSYHRKWTCFLFKENALENKAKLFCDLTFEEFVMDREFTWLLNDNMVLLCDSEETEPTADDRVVRSNQIYSHSVTKWCDFRHNRPRPHF